MNVAVDRRHNDYNSPYLAADEDWKDQNVARMNREPVTLTTAQRGSVERAIHETCTLRGWLLRATNVRTNHVHVVVSADSDRPERLLNALTANATRRLRADGNWDNEQSPWSGGGSKRYVWTELGLERTIDYVVNGQDGPIPELDPRNRRR